MNTPVRSLLAQSLAPTLADAHRARSRWNSANTIGTPMGNIYRETAHREAMRTLFNTAADLGAVVKVSYFKEDDQLRYMLARPLKDADYTRKYVTVIDLEVTHYVGGDECPAIRRICLDSITALELSYRAGGLE